MALFPHHRVTHCSRYESITKNTLPVEVRLLRKRSDSSESATVAKSGSVFLVVLECWPYFSVAGDRQGCDF